MKATKKSAAASVLLEIFAALFVGALVYFVYCLTFIALYFYTAGKDSNKEEPPATKAFI